MPILAFSPFSDLAYFLKRDLFHVAVHKGCQGDREFAIRIMGDKQSTVLRTVLILSVTLTLPVHSPQRTFENGREARNCNVDVCQ